MNEPEMFKTERLLKQNQSLYDKSFAQGYATAIEDTLKIVEAAFSKTGGGTMVTTILTMQIKALLPKGTK